MAGLLFCCPQCRTNRQLVPPLNDVATNMWPSYARVSHCVASILRPHFPSPHLRSHCACPNAPGCDQAPARENDPTPPEQTFIFARPRWVAPWTLNFVVCAADASETTPQTAHRGMAAPEALPGEAEALLVHPCVVGGVDLSGLPPKEFVLRQNWTNEYGFRNLVGLPCPSLLYANGMGQNDGQVGEGCYFRPP